MASCHQMQHAAGCPLSAKLRLPQRLHFRNAHSHKQQVQERPSSAAPVCAQRRNSSSRATQARRDRRKQCVVCTAAATQAPAAQEQENIPRGDTAGANLILENVTVQAGHRDLLEVSALVSLPHRKPHCACRKPCQLRSSMFSLHSQKRGQCDDPSVSTAVALAHTHTVTLPCSCRMYLGD